MNYKMAGVDIKNGDWVSDFLFNNAIRTWKNNGDRLRNIIIPYDDFSGVRYIDVSKLPEDTVMGMNLDGIGTKIGVAESLEIYKYLAYDLFAMVCDDAAAMGAEPVLVGTILDVDKISDYIKEIGESYVQAAYRSNVAIINGEVAELGDRIHGNSNILNLNWGASCVWFAKKSNLIDRYKITVGDYLVGIREYGFRSNGYSLVRKIVDENPNKIDCVNNLIIPSSIYTQSIVEMTGGYQGDPKVDIHGIINITGGGLYGKIRRMLKIHNLGANIYDPFEPSWQVKQIQEVGKVDDREAYCTWNMGQGMVIATPDPDEVIKIAGKHFFKAQIIGKVEKDDRIFIKNRGAFGYTDVLEFVNGL